MTCTRDFQMTRSWKIPEDFKIHFCQNFPIAKTWSMENGKIRQPSRNSDRVNEKTMVLVLVCNDFWEMRMYSTNRLPHTTSRLMPPSSKAITNEADIRDKICGCCCDEEATLTQGIRLLLKNVKI